MVFFLRLASEVEGLLALADEKPKQGCWLWERKLGDWVLEAAACC